MELNKMIKYRNIWMALAILWVMLFHSQAIIPNSIMDFIKQIGYGGVDIFFFASGLGCYYSLNKDSNVNEFIKRRIKKLMPTFWCFLLFYVIHYKFNDGIDITAIIGNILCIQTFTTNGNAFNWYICCLWLFYFLSPYIYFHTKNVKSIFGVVRYILLLLLFSIPFFRCHDLIIMITRLPIFFMGMYFAKLSTDKKYRLSKLSIILSIIGMIIGFVILKYCYGHYYDYLWDYGLHWYPFILIVPGLCICISLICELIDNKKIGKYIIKLFGVIGNNTFEIYLVHILLFRVVNKKISDGIITNSNIVWLKVLVQVAISAVLLKYITKLVMLMYQKIINSKLINKKSKKRTKSKTNVLLDKTKLE